MQTLFTPRLRLEPLVVAHAQALLPILSDARVLEFVEHGAPESLDALRERHRRLESRASADGREQWLNWALVALDDDSAQAIGFVQATVPENRRAWVAYELAPARWGLGLAAEAVRAMLDHLAAHYGAVQYRASVDRRNERSWRLLERLGFVRVEARGGDWLYERSLRADISA
jgi:[ribosomal protein S5]-alanine N-acetyltransferase